MGPVKTEDVCVPLGAVPEMLARIEKTRSTHAGSIASIARASDRNLHPLILVPHDNDGLSRERPQVSFALQSAVKRALDQHGILNPGKVITV